MKQETKEAIDRYVNEHLRTGGFLSAVLRNDLFAAARIADNENCRDLGEIVNYVWEHVPVGARGSVQAIEDWINQEVDARR